MSLFVAFTLEKGVRVSVRAGRTRRGGSAKKAVVAVWWHQAEPAPCSQSTAAWACTSTILNSFPPLSNPITLAACALNHNPATFLTMHTKEAKLGRKGKGSFFSSFPAYLRHAKDLPLPRGLFYRALLYKCNSGQVVLACHMNYALLQHMGIHCCRNSFEKWTMNFTPKGVSPYLSAEEKLTWTFWPHLQVVICVKS